MIYKLKGTVSGIELDGRTVKTKVSVTDGGYSYFWLYTDQFKIGQAVKIDVEPQE